MIDATSYDGWLLSLLPRFLRPECFAFSTHGLEHVVHDRLMEDVERGRATVSRKYRVYRGDLHLRLIAMAARRADLCLFLNDVERALAVRQLGVSTCRAQLAINGLSHDFLQRVRDIGCPSSPSDSAGLRIAFVGTFSERKGRAFLVPALNAYLKKHGKASASLLGVRASSMEVKGAFDAAVRDQLTVIEYFEQAELPELLSGHQVLVLPSLSEGFSLAGLEAMACGLVPVLSRDCGFEAYAEHEQNALLIERANTSAILEAICRLDADRPLLHRMQNEAQQTATRFTWSEAAKVREAGYRSAIAPARPREGLGGRVKKSSAG